MHGIYQRTGCLACVAVALWFQPAIGAPAHTYLMSYIYFSATPQGPGTRGGDCPPALLHLNQGISIPLGRHPADLLTLLRKQAPMFTYKTLLTGEVRSDRDGVILVDARSKLGMASRCSVRERIRLTEVGKGLLRFDKKGEVYYWGPGSTERDGWKWDGYQPSVRIGTSQGMGSAELRSGTRLFFVRSIIGANGP